MDALNLPRPDIKTLALSISGFVLFFGIGLALVDDGKYDERLDQSVGLENPEQVVEFDNRNITLIYEEATDEYFIRIGERYESLDGEGSFQRIHAVEDRTYMFHFQKNGNELRLFRVERL